MRRESGLVVGAGQAAAQLAMRIQQTGHDAPVMLVGDEPQRPCEPAPLSTSRFATVGAEQELQLRPDAYWLTKGVTLQLGCNVTRRGWRTVTIVGDTALDYADLVLAALAARRRLAARGTYVADVHPRRTLEDAERLRTELAGTGHTWSSIPCFIGLEVAAAARKQGVAVSVPERTERTMGQVVSERTRCTNRVPRVNGEAQRRHELGESLKVRRRQLVRTELGLPPVTGRGAPAVRREEVSYLSGVSITWYTWLEQGPEIKPSRQETVICCGSYSPIPTCAN